MAISRHTPDPLVLFGKPPPLAKLPAHVEHFGLVRAPFAAPTDQQFIFPSRSHSAVRAQMTQAIGRGEGLIVLTGESGTGKTTLCRFLTQSLQKPVFVSTVVDPFLSYEDLLRQVLVDFDVLTPQMAADGRAAQSGSHDLVLILNRFLAAMPPSARAIVVLDDGHEVRPAVLAQLRALTNLQTPAGKLLQIVLIGQPALASLFEQPEVRPLHQRVARWCVLEPLTNAEVGQYVHHKLTAAGQEANRSEPVMSPSTLRSLAKLSRGVPGRLDRLCDRAMEVAFERRAHQISRGEMAESAKRLNVQIPLGQHLAFHPLAVTLTLVTIVATSVALWEFRHSSVFPVFASRAGNSARATGGPSQSAQAPAVAGLTPSPAAAPPTTPSPTPLANTAGFTPADHRAVVAERLQTAESFLVVVASFKNPQGADDTVKTLTVLDLPAFRQKNGSWHVVLVGPYLTQDEAQEALGKISSREFKGSHIAKQTVPEDSAGSGQNVNRATVQ